jgi:uncharacterized protein
MNGRPNCSRRWRFVALGFVAIALSVRSLSAEPPGAKLFPLINVRLLNGPFKHAQDVNRRYMLQHDPDRLLAPFRTEAGLPAKAEMYHDLEDTGLAGHMAGHYLSALAQQFASTGDAEMKKRLDYMVAELAACQKALGDGYIGGVPNGIVAWDQMAAGTLIVNDPFHLNGLSVPWYNLHKTFAGLRDAWLVAGNAQARDVLVGLSDWCDVLTANLFDQQMQQMLDVEHGAMNEVLADVSVITGDQKYLTLAKRFSHRKVLDALMAKRDVLDRLHANTQIAKAIGFARIGEITNDPAWIDAARFFWDNVVTRRSVAIGGHGDGNFFNPVANFVTTVNGRGGPETCGSHNMLRLTEQLYRLDPDPKFADYCERTLFNHILASQHPETGGHVYATPLRPRSERIYSAAEINLWCCVGTGIQSHSKHGRFIYAFADDALYVNQFIASELDWPERKVKLRQETTFPDAPRTRLVVSTESPTPWALRVRCPGWVRQGECKISVNGEPWPGEAKPGSYVAIEREWRDGDRVDVELPMHTRLERLPDGKDFVAVMHGPIVLAAKVADPNLQPHVPKTTPNSHISSAPRLPIETAPIFAGDEETVVAAIQPVAGRPLTFTASGAIRPEEFRDLELTPFFRIHDARYMLYWPIAKAEE